MNPVQKLWRLRKWVALIIQIIRIYDTSVLEKENHDDDKCIALMLLYWSALPLAVVSVF